MHDCGLGKKIGRHRASKSTIELNTSVTKLHQTNDDNVMTSDLVTFPSRMVDGCMEMLEKMKRMQGGGSDECVRCKMCKKRGKKSRCKCMRHLTQKALDANQFLFRCFSSHQLIFAHPSAALRALRSSGVFFVISLNSAP